MAATNSSSTARQRPNAKKSKKKGETKKSSAAGTAQPKTRAAAMTEDSDAPNDQTLWQTFTGHWSLPFYGITIAVLLPYLLHNVYLHFRLQRPDLVAKYTQGMIQLRPAVALEETRPVLIVGTISGATTQVAHDLQYLMDLEVCHENSETTRHFCRDGTVSWFHGIRFLPRASETIQHFSSLAHLCTNFTKSMGFHPRMYRDTSNCSVRTQWSKCWARECLTLLHHEWGCAWVKDTNDAVATDANPNTPCQTPFTTTLHQARHPLRTMESLMAKFCPKDAPLDAGFAQMVQALFPQHNFANHSCLQATGYYVLEYHKAMQKAVKAGLIQQTYQVESTAPCQVASLAGFDGFGNDDAVWHGSKERVKRECENPMDGSKGHQPMVSTEYKINYGQVSLSESSFDSDPALWKKLVTLTKELGYASMEMGKAKPLI